MLGRMHVDVHVGAGEQHFEHVCRLPVRTQPVRTGDPNRVAHHGVAHRPRIHEEMLSGGGTSVEPRSADPPTQLEPAGPELDPQGILDESSPAEPGDTRVALPLVRPGPQAEHPSRVVGERDVQPRVAQREDLDHRFQVTVLGPFGAEKLPAGRSIEEQVPHFDRRSRRVRGRKGLAHLGRPRRLHLPGALRVLGARHQQESRYRGDARKRLAAKSQTLDVPEVFKAPNLARGVSAESQRQVVSTNSSAVVPYPDELRAAALDLHFDATRTRIDAVLEKLLQHRSRTLHYLARRDLVGESGVQAPDSHHGKVSTRAASREPRRRSGDA